MGTSSSSTQPSSGTAASSNASSSTTSTTTTLTGPTRSLAQLPPAGDLAEQPLDQPLRVVRSTRCSSGLINEYRNAA
jgi:hypothetical protein